MTEEKIIDTSQKENPPQDKSDNERLTDEQLNNVAGGLYTPESMDIAEGTMGK